MSKDSLFLSRVLMELDRSRSRFPKPDGCIVALMEEVGELAKAVLDESYERIYDEALQVAATAVRVAVEKDDIITELRMKRLKKHFTGDLDNLVKGGEDEHKT